MNDTERATEIERRIDKDTARALTVVDHKPGALRVTNALEAMETAKMMATARGFVREHLVNNPGGCLAIVWQATTWQMDPFAVAMKSYVVKGQIGYESQLVHAVIATRAPIQGRLKGDFKGEGKERYCIVTGHFKGEVDPVQYISPPVSKLDRSGSGSPLWATDPDQQLWYYATRAWARRFCPEVLLGVYTPDELQEAHIGAENAKDVTQAAAALPYKAEGEGYHPENVAKGLAGTPMGNEAELAEVVADLPEVPQTDTAPLAPEKPAGEVKPSEGTETAADVEKAADAAPVKPKRSRKKEEKEPGAVEAGNSTPPPETEPLGNAVEEMHGDGEVVIPPSSAPSAEPTGPQTTDATSAAPAQTDELPKTDVEYRAWLDKWLAEAVTETFVDNQWKAEKDLRTKCMVSGAVFDECMAKKKARMKAIAEEE